ncbi:MAG TPA: TonB-dependent receptor [Gemmatimonadaceae bacterium]|nr:TonB-dependent receptor [Gemmatimonadaceae bacterium]
MARIQVTRLMSTMLVLAPISARARLGAQQLPPTQRTEPVVQKTIEVVATRLPESPHDVPQSIEVFTAEDLSKLGATSLYEALALATGVAIAPGGDGGPASAVPEFWGLREFDAFLLVVDGVPAGGAFTPALASVSLKDVERVEILRGAAPVTYGATSFVGVIHVVHAAASARPNYASALGGSYGSGSAAIDLALPSARGWNSRLSADFERQGFKDERTSFARGHTLFRTERTGDASRTWLTADLNLLRQDPASPRPREGTVLSPRVGPDINHNPRGAFLDEDRLALGFGFERELPGGPQLSVTASVTQTGKDAFRGFLTSVSESQNNAVGLRQKIDQTEIYADVHVALPERGRVRLVGGADWLHGNADSKGAVFQYTAPLSGAVAPEVEEPNDLPIRAEGRRDFVGAYVLSEWRPVQRFTLSAGLRLNVTSEERGEGEEAEENRGSEPSQTNVRPSGSIGAIYSLWERGADHIRVFANYRNTFKPAVFDFGLGEAEGGEEELLEPETAQSVEGGVKMRTLNGRLDVEASLFRLDFDNLVTSVVRGGLPALENTGKTRFQGFELATDVRLHHAITGRFSYSFHDGKFVDYERSFDGGPPVQLAGNRVEMSPRHLLTAAGFLSPGQGVIGSLVIRYTGDRYLDKRNRALAEGFTTVDLGIGYRASRYEMRLDGRNLTDARDPVSESEVGDAQYYLMPARHFRLSLGVRF